MAHTTTEDFRRACLSLADDIEAGRVVPGFGKFYRYSGEGGDGSPCCSLGHMRARLNLESNTSIYAVFLEYTGNPTAADDVAVANDNGNWPEVVSLLRQSAEIAGRGR